MAQIILQILAVLGIILLCLLGLFLTLLLLILFVPVRYRLSGQKSGKETEGRIRLSWLLHLLSASYGYPSPGEAVIRVAGIRVRSIKVGMPQKQDPETDGEGEENPVNPEILKAAGEGHAPPETETAAKNADVPHGIKETEKADMPESGRKESLSGKIGALRHRLRRIWKQVNEILQNIEYYRELLLQKENRLLYGRCWKQIRRILYYIRPQTIKGDIVVGTGAPDTTGYLLAVYGMMLPFLGNHINIVPDFNEAVLEGNLFLKGRVTLFVLLRGSVKILLDKQLHRLIGKLKREEK